MNKKIIFAAVGAVSLVGGIIAGIVHRSNKRYRRALSELEVASEVLERTTDVLVDTIDYLMERECFDVDFDDEEDDEVDE